MLNRQPQSTQMNSLRASTVPSESLFRTLGAKLRISFFSRLSSAWDGDGYGGRGEQDVEVQYRLEQQENQELGHPIRSLWLWSILNV